MRSVHTRSLLHMALAGWGEGNPCPIRKLSTDGSTPSDRVRALWLSHVVHSL